MYSWTGVASDGRGAATGYITGWSGACSRSAQQGSFLPPAALELAHYTAGSAVLHRQPTPISSFYWPECNGLRLRLLGARGLVWRRRLAGLHRALWRVVGWELFFGLVILVLHLQ